MGKLAARAIETVKFVWHTYISSRTPKNIRKLISLIDENVIFIGTGKSEFCHGKKALLKLFAIDQLDVQLTPYEMVNDWYEAQEISATVCLVFGGFLQREKASDNMPSMAADMDTRYTITCQLIEGKMKITSIHHSTPNAMQLELETHPKKNSAEANIRLRERLNKTYSDLLQLAEKKERDEVQYKTALESICDLVFEFNYKSKSILVDPEKLRHFCLTSESAIIKTSNINHSFFNILYSEDKERYLQWFKEIRKNIAALNTVEVRLRALNKPYIWISITLVPIFDEYNQIEKYIGCILNIDAKKEHEAQLITLAENDSLTSTLNRKFTEISISTYLSQPGYSGSMFMLDIDNFKKINDTHGHLYGDQVLLHISGLLKNIFHNQHIVGRMGGDEFIVFIKNITQKAILNDILDCLMSNIRVPFIFDNKTQNITISIGVAIALNSAVDFQTLWTQADKALYTAKKQGKNTYKYYEDTLL